LAKFSNTMSGFCVTRKLCLRSRARSYLPTLKKNKSIKLIVNKFTQRTYCTGIAAKGTLIPLPEIKRFIIECMTKVGTATSQAEELADVLIAADYRGHYSHGLNRLGKSTMFNSILFVGLKIFNNLNY